MCRVLSTVVDVRFPDLDREKKLDGLTDQIGPVVAKEALGLSVDQLDPAIAADHDNRVGRRVEQRPKCFTVVRDCSFRHVQPPMLSVRPVGMGSSGNFRSHFATEELNKVEVRQLQHFVAVAEEHHFTRAAARSHLSQSALSASIRSLERELGTPLFVRTTRRVELTPAGQALVDHARLILDTAAAAREVATALDGRLGGTLDVGGIPTGAVLNQAKLLADFRSRHPYVRLNYRTGTSPELLEDLRSGQLDVAIISVPHALPVGCEVRPLASVPMKLICRPDHPLAGQAIVDMARLERETFIGGAPHSVNDDAIQRVKARRAADHRDPEVSIRANDVRSILELVAYGLGVALLPGYLADSRPPLVAVPISDPTFLWTLGVVTALLHHVSPATRAMLDILDADGATTGLEALT